MCIEEPLALASCGPADEPVIKWQCDAATFTLKTFLCLDRHQGHETPLVLCDNCHRGHRDCRVHLGGSGGG